MDDNKPRGLEVGPDKPTIKPANIDEPSRYTSTRISREYLVKLQDLADRHKRTMARQLEVMIDEANR